MNEGLSITVSAPTLDELTKKMCDLAALLSADVPAGLPQALAASQVPVAQQPAAPAPAQTPTPQAPTAPPPQYTLDQLARAATPLADAGKQAELVQLLGQFGVQALTQLPQEQYGAFATGLRALGVKI